jgi:hypothetical protein
MATKALIHNGCTTGVEAYVMRVPALSYRATVNEDYDYGFYFLPNKISHQCFNFEELKKRLQRILGGEIGTADGNERQALIDHHLAAQEGPLACERMVDVIETISKKFGQSDQLSSKNQLQRWTVTLGLHLAKNIKSKLPGSHNRPEFQRHRYPGISGEALHAKLSLFQQLLGNNRELKLEQISGVMFKINTVDKIRINS